MNAFKFNIKPKNKLTLDPDFSPMILNNIAFEEAISRSPNPCQIKIAVERNDQQVYSKTLYVFNETLNQSKSNFVYLERLIKTLIWVKGAYRIYIAGNEKLANEIKQAYQKNGLRSFDSEFMSNVYEKPFEVIICNLKDIPTTYEISKPIGRHLEGNRIGFDAGGSDRKVSAVIDGKAIFSEEVVWFPKTNSDPKYHYDGIMDSIKRAASKLPRVDAIGVSSAGIFINNRVAVASLFRKVPQDLFDKEVRDMYLRIKKEFGNVPIEVINDGDVTALAGSMNLNANNVLGIAMGTSQAAGYVDKLGNITGWLNELSFVPVDYNKNAMVDEWSKDIGVGVHYFSQDAVIKLADVAGIELEPKLSPAEKLKIVQEMAINKDINAIEIFKTIGVYLGYSLAYYARFYDLKEILILGRVTSGIGGNLILKEAKKILKNEFKELFEQINISLPDELERRVGQSIAAASLPNIRKVD